MAEDKREIMLELIREFYYELHPQSDRLIRVTLDTSLIRDIGVDSLGMVELVHRVEERFDVALSEQVMASAETPRDLLRVVAAVAAPGEIRLEEPIKAVDYTDVGVVPEDAKTLLDVLDWHVKSHEDRIHIRFYKEEGAGGDDRVGSEPITYGQLQSRSERVAAGLQACGLKPGESVAIMLPTGADYFYSFFGTLLAGGVPVPIYPPARLSQIEDHLHRHGGILNNSLAAVLITVPEGKMVARLLKSRVVSLKKVVTPGELFSERGDYSRPIIRENDTALLQYTSGTTGNPKGVVLTHSNLLANIRAMGENVEATHRDVFVSWLPLYHDMGLIGAWLGSLYYGMHLVLLSPLSFLASPENWLRAIHRYRGTISGGPNFGYELCLRKLDERAIEGLDLSSWRMAFNGAEPVSPETITRFQERFREKGFNPKAFAPVYGLAESSVGLSFPPLGRGPIIDRIERESFTRDGHALPVKEKEDESHALRFVSLGRPLRGHEIRIVDDNGREVGERFEGLLQFKGPSVTDGYFRNPEATESLFDGEWLNSGDLAYMAGGDVYMTGRSKDIIIRAGRNIYPDELEEAVGNVPGIRKGCVAAFGSTDPDSGTERLVVLAETREVESAAMEELYREVNSVTVDLAGTPPEDIMLVPPRTILKTSSGKIRRAASKELYEKGRIGAGRRATWLQFTRLALTGVLPELRRLWRGVSEFLYASYSWSVFCLLAIATWMMVATVPGLKRRRTLVQKMARLAVRLTKIHLTVSGMENIPTDGACLVAANHLSSIDAIALAAVMPTRFGFVAKRDLKWGFIPRLFLRRLDARIVERFDLKGGREGTRYLSKSIKEGMSLIIFVEGIVRRMPGLLPFHMGGFVAAAEAGVPVVPVTIKGTRSILRASSWFPRRGAVSVTVGEPITVKGSDWAAALKLRDIARAEILRHCGEPDLADRVSDE